MDYSEFIARHHKTAQPVKKKVRRRVNYGMLSAVLAVLLCLSAIFFLITIADMKHETTVLAGVVLVLAITLSAVAYRAMAVHKKLSDDFALLQSVLEGSRGARLITDDHDETVFYNERFERLCSNIGEPGYDSLVALFEDNEEALAHFRLLADQAHRGLTDSIELYSANEKQVGWYIVTAQPIAERRGYIHWRIDNVTQKHDVDRAVKEEREKLIDFTDNAPVGFFSVDENGKFVFANATFARWIGEDLQTLLSLGTLHTYLMEPPKNVPPYALVAKGGKRQVVEMRMKGPAGKSFLASINQVVVEEPDGRVRTRAVVHDLTSEREMRMALQASEDRFLRFFEEAPVGIILVNQDGKIEDCNSEFAGMLETTTDDIEGLDFSTLVTEEDRDQLGELMEKIAEGKKGERHADVILQRDGKEITAQMHARRFKEGGSIVLHFIDLREQKALEEQFVQSQKMQAVGQLAGGIAHDFNNLLTAIIGFCDLLLLRHKPGDPSFGDIMQVKQNSSRAANLVRQLLAFSRQQTLRPKVHDVADILTELSHLLRRLIGANIELELVHGDDLGLVKVDEGQMEQVLINMAVNARDAMDGGGKLRIETENFTNKKPKELASEELPAGHWTLIKVTDTGCGIPKENMNRIFEPFFTTKDVGHGTGLGLATVYGIVRQTGGFLDVDSVVDKGTTFLIYLPRADETDEDEDEGAAEIVKEDTRDLTGTERILLVEDEEAVRMFSKRALTNKGYEVLTADSGEAALTLMEKEENKHLDLLVTDVVMPNMDGPTLAQRIRQGSPDLKIIFISGYTEDKLKDHMGDNIFFLPKPFTLKQLAGKVKEVLED